LKIYSGIFNKFVLFLTKLIMKSSSLCLLVGIFCCQYTFSQSVETIIGNTTYDLQTGGSVAPRIVKNGNTLSAAWTYSSELSIYNDRGTGYNFFNGTSWGPIPGSRIENVRTGWPSLLNTIGQEFVISHDGTSGLKIAKRTTIGSGAWILTDMPNPTGRDLLWPRAVSGGANGQSIHVICLTEPLSLGGTLYNGINGALLYYRSTNAGASWDVQAIQIPGTESSSNAFLDQDSYSIFTRGDEIIIGVFNALHDTYVLRSSDNGSTWTKTVIVDFPSETYQIDNWPDTDFDGLPDQVFNSDGSGHVFIDTNGQGHAVFGALYYTDNIVGDNGYQLNPFTDGLMYWRDDFGANTYNQIASTPDLNGNGGIDVGAGQLPIYGSSMCSHPTMAEGIGGNLFITFTAPSELHFSSGNQVYRHVFLTTSSNGVDWSYPEDLTPNANISGYEYFAPSLYPVGDSHLHYVVQRDTEPGLSVTGDFDAASVNQIVYAKYELGTLGCTNPSACNYDSAASLDNGSCVFCRLHGFKCMQL
jgi:hypothetical protein